MKPLILFFFFLLHICQPSRMSRRFQKLSGKSEFQGMDATGLSGSTVWRVTVNLTFTESWILSSSWSPEPSVQAASGLLLAELLIPDHSPWELYSLRYLYLTLVFIDCVRLGLVSFFLSLWVPQILGTDYCWDIVQSCVSFLVVFFIFDGWQTISTLI